MRLSHILASVATQASIAGASFNSPAPELCSKRSVQVTTNSSSVWPWLNYVSSDAQPPYLEINGSGKSLAPGSIFFTPQASSTDTYIPNTGPFIVTDDGDLIWKAPPPVTDASNFRVQTLYNKSVLSFWVGTGAASNGGDAGHGYGKVLIYNSSYDLVTTVCPTLNLTLRPGTTAECELDVHESLITDRNTLLATAYNVTQTDLTPLGGPQDGWIFDCLVIELDIATNEILFLWSAIEHIPINATNLPLSSTGTNSSDPFDFFHVNAIQLWEAQYLVNSRHTWSTYLLNTTGDIVWEINGKTGGDFGSLPAGIEFGWQHFARIRRTSNSTANIHWFANNNWNTSTSNTSIGLELALTLPPNPQHPPKLLSNLSSEWPVAASAMGSHDILSNGHHLLGYGIQPRIEEYGALTKNNNSDLRWSAKFGYHNGAASYRAYKQDWHAVPSSKPSLVVVGNSTQQSEFTGCVGASASLRGYVSWNGATDIKAYRLYAGKNSSSLSLTGIVLKQGFETEFVVPNDGYKYFQIGAVFGQDGDLERRSNMTTIS